MKDGIKAKLLYSTQPSEYSAQPEFMFREILMSGSERMLLGLCMPPKVRHLTDLESVLLRFMPSYRLILTYMGDFNTT